MDGYTFTGFEYLKYYILQLYYVWYEYPPVVRWWSLFVTAAAIVIIVLFAKLYYKAQKEADYNLRLAKYTKRYYDIMRAIVLTPDNLAIDAIAEDLALAKNYKATSKKTKFFVPILRDLWAETKADANLNKQNWTNLTLALKMPAFFENQVRSYNLKKRLSALKDVTDNNTNLKEAVASRYLFAKDEKLRMSSRLHVARYSTAYPFKALEEDPNLYISEEMMVKLHNVLKYRMDNDMSIPNLIHWCNLYPVNESLRLFAVTEMRLLEQYKDCPELLDLLKLSKDEKFSIEAIKTLGALKYRKAEPEFLRRYAFASNAEREGLANALGNIRSDNSEVIEFLVKDYKDATEAVNKVHLLKVLYDYGPKGLEAYKKLKEECPEDDLRFFDHIECEYIDSTNYA